MTTTRSDIHRPSATDFDPQAYDFYGVFDNDPESGDAPNRQATVRLLVNQGFKSGYGSSSKCGHCGAAIRYAALMVREDVKQFIFVGETCLEGRFEATKAEFAQLREDAKLHKAAKERAARREALLAAHPFLVEIATLEDAGEFLSSIAHQIATKGELSERQIESAEKALSGHKRFLAICAQREAEKAAAVASGTMKPAPVGKTIVTGTVLSVKVHETQYGVTYKMVVETTEGWKVWVTVPSSIEKADKGDVVTFTATITPSDDDQYFAFGKRPTKASIVK